MPPSPIIVPPPEPITPACAGNGASCGGRGKTEDEKGVMDLGMPSLSKCISGRPLYPNRTSPKYLAK